MEFGQLDAVNVYFGGTLISVLTFYNKYQAVMTIVGDDDDYNGSCNDNEKTGCNPIQHIDKQQELNKAGCCGRIDSVSSIVSWRPLSNIRQVVTYTHTRAAATVGRSRGGLPYIIHYSNEGGVGERKLAHSLGSRATESHVSCAISRKADFSSLLNVHTIV